MTILSNCRIAGLTPFFFFFLTPFSNEGRVLRKEAFEAGVATGHNPASPELKRTKDHINEDFEQYLEDPSYTQPKINLTPLGESLLGL